MAEKKTTIDDLALMIGKGFEHVDKRMDSLEKRMDSLDGRMDSLDGRMDSLDGRMDSLEKNNTREHEDIVLRLDNTAYRFELVELKKRVEVLEKKEAARV